MRKSWGNRDCSACRIENAGETLLWASSIFRGPLTQMGANVSAGPVELGQGKMFLTKRELICTIKRKNFSAVRAVIHWHMLPGEVVSAVSLETLKIRSNQALNNLIHLRILLLIGGPWTRRLLKAFFNPKYSMIPAKCTVRAEHHLVSTSAHLGGGNKAEQKSHNRKLHIFR